jgi:hypothetical protein
MARPKTAVANYKKLMLRIPEDLLQACRQAAEENHRSMNAQILHVLTQWVNEEKKSHARRSRKN